MLSGKQNGEKPLDTKKTQAIAVFLVVLVFLVFCVMVFAPLYEMCLRKCTFYEVPGLEEYLIAGLSLFLIYAFAGGLYAGALLGLYYLGDWIYELWTGKGGLDEFSTD